MPDDSVVHWRLSNRVCHSYFGAVDRSLNQQSESVVIVQYRIVKSRLFDLRVIY